MNEIQLKVLTLSVITEIKHNMPLARNAVHCKVRYKKMMGIPKNTTNRNLLAYLCATHWENGLVNEFKKTLRKFFPDAKSLEDILDMDLANRICASIHQQLGYIPKQKFVKASIKLPKPMEN